MKYTVVFDFDGVIHSYKSGWKGAEVIPDPPVEGIREAIADIRNADYEVAVVSTRCATPAGLEAVKTYLANNDIIVDKVCAEKPPAIVYIDDRALCFDGQCHTLLEKIKNFKPWYQSSENKTNPCDSLTSSGKIKAIYPHIVVTGDIDKPYYSIHWYDIKQKTMICGYGSYDLKLVRKWLQEDFEVVDDDIDNYSNQLQAENESLNSRIFVLNDTNKKLMDSQEIYWQNKVKEFAERLKEELVQCDVVIEGDNIQGIIKTGYDKDDVNDTIDNIVKEKVGTLSTDSKPCFYCNNARINHHLTDENDYSSLSIGEACPNFRIMFTSGSGKPPRIEFETWNNDHWSTVGVYYPKHCPYCGREINEYGGQDDAE